MGKIAASTLPALTGAGAVPLLSGIQESIEKE